MAAESGSAAPAPDKEKDESFEALLERLEEIVSQLEAGERPLDESLALYENGVAALKRCHVTLDRAEKRIRLLLQDANGNPQLREAEIPKRAEKASGRTLRPATNTPAAPDAPSEPNEEADDTTDEPEAAREVQKKVENSADQHVDSEHESQHNPPSSVKSKSKSNQGGGKAGGLLFGSAQ